MSPGLPDPGFSATFHHGAYRRQRKENAGYHVDFDETDLRRMRAVSIFTPAFFLHFDGRIIHWRKADQFLSAR